jgi:type I restriction enzyme M protein
MNAKLINPFDLTQKKTELTNNQKIIQWINQIIKDKKIELGLVEGETKGEDKKLPDIIIYDKPKSNKIVCIIELKQPYHDVFHYYNLKKPALEKANFRKAKYFCCCNYKLLILYKTEEVNKGSSEEKQIVNKYILSNLEDPNRIEDLRYKNSIITNLEIFLNDLSQYTHGKKQEPKLPVDELLVFRLQEKIKFLAPFYQNSIEEKIGGDIKFHKKVKEWFKSQSWNFTYDEHNYRMLALQTAYTLTIKILFYNCLKSKFPQNLAALSIPEDIPNGKHFKRRLQVFFDDVLDIDYEPIFSTDFIDEIAFPDYRAVIDSVLELIYLLKKYDFSSIGYDIVGQIFEKLIPVNERHILGQYFTKSEVVDLILSFCIQTEDDKIFDPACGAGTFLVRAYKFKQLMKPAKKHSEILQELWGSDIARFPAMLSTTNLAILDLGVVENYPFILNKDFFKLKLAGLDEFNNEARNSKLTTINNKKIIIPYPKNVDCIVGNPPYTRQEEIAEMVGGDEKFKTEIINTVLNEGNGKLIDISRRAGIYVYFIIQSLKFLKTGGRLGFIVPTAWLNVEYGINLQYYLLNHCKIITIISSRVERWFEDADVNTIILIIEKCEGEKFKQERDKNIIRFLTFNKNFKDIVSLKNDTYQEEVDRLHSFRNIVRSVQFHNQDYVSEDFNIKTVLQKDLLENGTVDGIYKGTNWERYLDSKEIVIELEEKLKDTLIPLEKKANVRRGFTTGCNEFFYPSESSLARFEIEEKFLQPVVFSLKEIEGYKVDRKKLKKKVVICNEKITNLKYTKIKKYINWGEKQRYNKRSSCSSRKIWYSIGKDWKTAPILFPSKVGERMPVIKNIKLFEDKKFYGILPKKKSDINILLALLNSSLTRLFVETSCRQLTGAQTIADIDVRIVNNIKIIDYDKFSSKIKNKLINACKNLFKTKAGNLKEEYGTDNIKNFQLNKVKKERLVLDMIIFRDILNLKEDKIIEIYKTIINIVNTRKTKSKSVNNNNNFKNGINITKLLNLIENNIDKNLINKFYKKVNSLPDSETIVLPEYNNDVSIVQDIFGIYVKTDKEEKICKNIDEAKFLKNWVMLGLEKINLPKNIEAIKKLNDEFEKILKKYKTIYNNYTDGILSIKVLDKIESIFWKKFKTFITE